MGVLVPWTKKYMPKNMADLQGIDSTVSLLKEYVVDFKRGVKPILLTGSPGCGKTSSVYAIANELNLEIFELNSSDERDKNAILERAGNACLQGSLFGSKKLILLEEIDGLSGSQDRGGLAELIKLFPKSLYPIIMTANDPWDKKFSALRSKSSIVTIKTPSYLSVTKVLEKICLSENLTVEKDILQSIARRNGGDFRGAINDLQMLFSGNSTITRDNLLAIGDRNKTETMLNALLRIFKTKDASIALSSFDDVQEDTDAQILWIEENIPHEYTNRDDLIAAFDSLSKADVYRGRIRRWQHWRFLAYINELITAGIAIAKKEKYAKFISYKQTSRILKIWMANQSNARKKSICEKIALKTHLSSSQVFLEFDTLKKIILGFKLEDFFDLDSDDIKLLKSK
ncbi:replication factor C large subunit [Candidatus Woesearchaeota archaeon]|nr:replication factor C large subunit [Candidatus Woesearchaeota archaeon]